MKGTPDCQLGSKAVCIAAVSSDANCRLRLEMCSFSTILKNAGFFIRVVGRDCHKVELTTAIHPVRCLKMWQFMHTGPHHVAQKSIRSTLPVPFERSFFRSATDAEVNFTGSASIFFCSSCLPLWFDIHFVEHPKAANDRRHGLSC